MKAKDKAEELVKKYNNFAHSNPSHESELFYRRLKENSIECALICVEEIIKSLEKLLMETYTGYYVKEIARERDFYEEVKDELNKMK